MGTKVIILAIAAGTVSGVGASVAMSWLARATQPGATVAEPEASARAEPPAETGAGKGARAALSQEEQLARAVKEHESALLAHEKEGVDPEWAPRSADAFTAALSALAPETRFQIIHVDCRRTSCVAALRWGSYEDARKDFRRIARQRYPVNCARDVFLPPPAEPLAPYEAKIIFGSCEGRS